VRARKLYDACESSRAAIYRRRERLVDAGFVREETAIDPDGPDCKLFRLVRDTFTVTIENGGVTVTVQSRAPIESGVAGTRL
jgi:hypothetical protein